MVRNTEVRILEETEYPFRESVRIKIEPAIALSFPLRLRIPAWASVPVILVNGLQVDAPHDAGFAKIERTWKAGDVVELRLPMSPRVVKGYNDSVSIVSGPLVFSLPIGESWVKLRDQRDDRRLAGLSQLAMELRSCGFWGGYTEGILFRNSPYTGRLFRSPKHLSNYRLKRASCHRGWQSMEWPIQSLRVRCPAASRKRRLR